MRIQWESEGGSAPNTRCAHAAAPRRSSGARLSFPRSGEGRESPRGPISEFVRSVAIRGQAVKTRVARGRWAGAFGGLDIQVSFRIGRAIVGIAVVALGAIAWRAYVQHEVGRARSAHPRFGANADGDASAGSAQLGAPSASAARELAAGVNSAPGGAAAALPTPRVAPPLWRAAEGEAPALASLVNGFVRETEHVTIRRDALGELEFGSLVPIELPGGERYFARVERLIAHDTGDRSWSGHLDGYGLQFPVIYTQGDVATFGTIATPKGLYALEANGEDGVLFLDEREHLQDPDRECQLIPD
jgi:hypothetical protein